MKKPVILCVDDEKMVLSSLKSELKEAFGNGYTIEVCEDPSESIEIFKELIDSGHQVPLVISDYVMPVMKGDELLKKLHLISPETHKIMLTGQATTEGVTNAVNWARLYRYIGKPWEVGDLCLTVKEAIRSYNQEQKLMEQYLELKSMNADLEKKVEERTAEVIHKNEILEQQKEELNSINNDITDSIKAASMIQQALLPSEQSFASVFALNDYFVFYRPKDIVSGDFYWFKDRNRYSCLAVADCTGHGVPGALMSMLGISILNEITSGCDCQAPGQILDQLRTKLISLLNQQGKQMRDGMDIALCLLDKEERKLHFAGAYNPLYLIRKNQSTAQFEISMIKADRMPIGVHPNAKANFTTQVVDLQVDDRIYLFSDGITSQFGGEKGKKIKPHQFEEFLLSIQDCDMQMQNTKLDSFFNDWKKDAEQIDDIVILGVHVTDSFFATA